MRYSDEQIAHVVHEANRALQIIQEDEVPSLPWGCETDEIRKNAEAGVRAARDGVSPRGLHEMWVRDKAANGWRYGPVKDAAAKTHPCMVSYDDLPDGQRDKDRVFIAIVEAMTLGMMGVMEATSVACPECHAVPGEQCHDSEGRPLPRMLVHRDRLMVWRDEGHV